MNTKPFKGSNVFMSRKLVPPELYDSLHDALKLNGADVFLCSDPSRNSPNDFHVISSMEHEKYHDLREKGCNMLGPQCVLSCAKERRPLPKLGFACCLAMDSVKVLASGFSLDEREKIEKLVIAMGGSFLTKASSDVSFVIVKNVTAGKYKWAVNSEKHVVTINWLYQCWSEHRVVPVESYRVSPFSGLVICVSRIPGDERKEMEKLISQNGGKYSAELTRLCTHLICEVPEGDKFKVAQRWPKTRIVTRKWFDQSIARRVCLNEELFPVQSGSVSSRGKLKAKSGQDNSTRNSQSVLSTAATDSFFRAVPSAGNLDSDMDVVQSQNFSPVLPDVSACDKEKEAGPPELPDNDTKLEGCVADDSEADDGLYLSDCRICLVGFDSSVMRKLVAMVRRGGGSRYMSWSEKLTHVVVGAPSDLEKRNLRGLAALGVIHFVRRNWLEDCDREKKEVPVIQKYIAYDILLPKDLTDLSKKAASLGMSSTKPGECSTMFSNVSMDLTSGAVEFGTGISLDKGGEGKTDIYRNGSCSLEGMKRVSQSDNICAVNGKDTSQQKIQLGKCVKSSDVFVGKVFCFSRSFAEERRDEVVQWINEGGGQVADDPVRVKVDFTVESHGVNVMLQSSSTSQTTYVSSHWVRCCLEDGCLLDVGSHILYSPLPCRIPLPGFQGLKFCVSQYMNKERGLLRNLCFSLGAKFAEKLTRKVTHLLCKFASGPKYEAADRYGIQTVTCEWLYECVRKDDVVAVNNFLPKEAPQDSESGLYTVSQYTQSQFSCQTQDFRNAKTESSSKRLRLSEMDLKSNQNMRVKSTEVNIYEDGKGKNPVVPTGAATIEDLKQTSKDLRKTDTQSSSEKLRSSDLDPKSNQETQLNSTEVYNCEDDKVKNHVVPDVAAAIEDLLEQTSKIQDLKSPVGTEGDKSIFSSDCPMLGREHTGSHSAFGPSRQWLSSLENKEDPQNASKEERPGIHDGFSETQTESQLVGYEEDLSGRQMIIDRVRTRSSMT